MTGKKGPQLGGFDMTQIVLSPEQAAVVATAKEPVWICLPDGSVAGCLSSTIRLKPRQGDPTSEEIADIKRRMASPGPRHSTQEVLDHIRSLEQG
jgi:hypothetical protein